MARLLGGRIVVSIPNRRTLPANSTRIRRDSTDDAIASPNYGKVQEMAVATILRSAGKILQTIIVAIAVFAAVVYSIDSQIGENHMSWSETFTGPAGSPPNALNWNAVQGSGVAPVGGGNNELQTYTPESLALDGKNNLVITAALNNGQYTSGKLWTIGLLNFKYGHIAIRAAFPDAGKGGYWPAFWMLGSDYPS